ncbi:hypothetical protein PFICI_07734 [Pestalotiopsis fici W106-1]|uniref:Zn(2)-C6 fungal-type domain-containing protein n=1 Tax=Pestalotiopsis fici (strain W106-1 / CGMCC3.15140) TaxID=1229662 RepID=W3X297_PESFW|nr:uncharacterized protein PFICI_07734 [Pestalotiopsis fici W106-1]ETS80205.1 hypothetical protein PFICI_07734 [Pestalotiopsis fici W106-1]
MARERSMARFNLETGKGRPGHRREKYTRQACETCKTRKVKCSGLVPCSRCVELDIDCLYQEPLSLKSSATDNTAASGRVAKRRRTSNSSSSDLGQLVLTMRKVCDEIESSASSYDLTAIPNRSLKRSLRHVVSRNPTVASPTPGYVALLSRAQDFLHQKGFVETCTSRENAEKPATDVVANAPAPADDILRAAKPILHLGQAEALRYLSLFKDHVYSAYPCINLSVATERLIALYSARTPPGGGNKFQDLGLDLIDVELMKATFSIAMILDGEHDNPLCRDLKAHLLWNTDFTMNEEHAQVEDVIMATLLTIYLILKDKPLQAWRMIGLAARTSLELGLHTEKPVGNTDQPPRLQNREIFSCVYDLDKRCSFFADLPWALHYENIDAKVLNLNDRHSYMSAMLGLNRIHTEVINFNAAARQGSNQEMDEQIEMYDYRTQKLMDKICAKGLFPASVSDTPPVEVQNTMTSMLQLRANQIRMSAHIRYLSNSYDGESNKDQAIHTIVSLAMSSVDVYLGMLDTSLLWRPLADRLLMHSTSCMFLAASQDSSKYGPLCRKSFHTAIDCLTRSSYRPTESASGCSLDDMRSVAGKIQMPPFDESPAPEEPPSGYLQSVSVFDNNLSLSAEELAQLCGDSGQSSMSAFRDAASIWENQFNEFAIVE